jgi:hypothetical protein
VGKMPRYVFDYSEAAMRKAYYNPWIYFSEFIWPLEHLRADGFQSSPASEVPNVHTVWLTGDQVSLI